MCYGRVGESISTPLGKDGMPRGCSGAHLEQLQIFWDNIFQKKFLKSKRVNCVVEDIIGSIADVRLLEQDTLKLYFPMCLIHNFSSSFIQPFKFLLLFDLL